MAQLVYQRTWGPGETSNTGWLRTTLLRVGKPFTQKADPGEIPEGFPSVMISYATDGYIFIEAVSDSSRFFQRSAERIGEAWRPYLTALGLELKAHWPTFNESLHLNYLVAEMNVGPEVANNLPAFAKPLEAFCKDWLEATMPRVTAGLIRQPTNKGGSHTLAKHYLSYFGPDQLIQVDKLLEQQ